jgi:hypothetical protein
MCLNVMTFNKKIQIQPNPLLSGFFSTLVGLVQAPARWLAWFRHQLKSSCLGSIPEESKMTTRGHALNPKTYQLWTYNFLI